VNRTSTAILIAVAMLSMSVPGQVSAHASTAADLNELAYDNVWQILGPGGETDDPTVKEGLSALGLDAEERGGEAPDDNEASCTHHDDGIIDGQAPGDNVCTDDDGDSEPDDDVQNLKFFQCQGAKSFANPTEQADLEFEAPFPVNHNDLENGIFEATGSFFVPVQFNGTDAERVSEVHFGFAHTFAWPASSSLCQPPFPLSGAYYEFYRGDTTPEDGFEIPVNTLLVPDAPYGAVLRALDETGNTLGVAFVYANVNNYLNDANFRPNTPSTCENAGNAGTDLCPYHDTTPPRATVYKSFEMPDDVFPRGENADDECTEGVALEYGEPVETFEVTRPNGNSVSFDTYDPANRDVDSTPLVTTARDDWGPGLCILSPPGEFTVKAWDQSGNIGAQTITT
jgi:hypothetical protein